MRVLLVGGGELGGRLAEGLLGAGVSVFGVGPTAPRSWPEAGEWRRDGIDAPEGVGAVIAAVDPEVLVCVASEPGASEVLALGLERAGSDAPSCRRLVYWGPHRVYAPDGGPPLSPLREGAALVVKGPFRGWADVDRRIGGLGEASGQREVFRFRAAPVAGPETAAAELPLTEAWPIVRSPSDPPFQLTHVEDAVAILIRACTSAQPGTYNVASDGLLFRSRSARGFGRLAIPLPRSIAAVLYLPGRLRGRPRSLRRALARVYEPLVIDNRRLKTHFGYRPRHSCREALVAVAGRRHR